MTVEITRKPLFWIVSSVSEFALSGSNFGDVDHILDISDVLEESDGTDSLLGSFCFLCAAEKQHQTKTLILHTCLILLLIVPKL